MINVIEKMFSQHKVIISGFMWRSLQMFGKQGIIFLIFLLCAKLLSPYDFGVYNYILAIVFFLVMFGDFGISTATARYVAEYNIENKAKLRSVLFNAGFLIFFVSLLISAFVFTFGAMFLGNMYSYVLWMLPLIFLSPMTSLYDGIYRGLKKFKSLAIISLTVSFFSIFIVYFFVQKFGLIGALFSQILFYLILLVSLATGYREHSFFFNKEVLIEIGKYSFTYGVAILGNYLFIRSGILILGHNGYITEIGMYELLNKIFTILLLPFVLLGQVMAPNFTELAAKKNYLLIFQKTLKYTKYFFFVGLFLGLVMYVLIPPLIKLLFPLYYNSLFFAIFPFVILIYIANIWAATIDSGILVPTGFAHLMAYFYIVLGTGGTLLSFVLLQYCGYMGVIYSFTISSFLMSILMRIIFLIKILRFNVKS